MTAKKPPLLIPLIIQKRTSGAREVETGHRTSRLKALAMSDAARELRGPSLSPMKPVSILPTAEEKLKAATRAAPMLEE
jgi:hypothetical protein